jgi:hypothetical protein
MEKSSVPRRYQLGISSIPPRDDAEELSDDAGSGTDESAPDDSE